MIRYRHAGPALIACCIALATPSRTDAWGTESLGNKPVTGWGFDNDLLAAVNVPERVYWFEVNGNPYFYFRGSSRAVNDAIRKFLAIPAEKREIILLPGPGETKSFSGKDRIEFTWSLHVPGGLRFSADADVGDTRATLTIHILEPRPAPLGDAAQFRRWIADLDNDEFKVRDKAARELEKLGRSAASALRVVLKGKTSVEVQNRLERLLGRLETVELDLLELPAKMPVIGLETLLERARKATMSKDSHTRGYALTSLTHHSAGTGEVLPDLLKVLDTESHEYVLRCAASALARLGAAAKPAILAMRLHAKSADENVRHSFTSAIDIIEKEIDKSSAVEPDAKKRSAIRRDISEFVKARGEKK